MAADAERKAMKKAARNRGAFIRGVDRQTDEIARNMELEFGQKNLMTDAKDLTPWNAVYRRPVDEFDKDYVAYR